MDDGDPDDAVSSETLLMRRLREVEIPKWMLLTASNRKAAINRIQPILVEAPLSSKARTKIRTAMPSELRSLLILAETETGKKLLAEDPGYNSMSEKASGSSAQMMNQNTFCFLTYWYNGYNIKRANNTRR